MMMRLRSTVILCAWLVAIAPAIQAASDPAYYAKQGDWHGTVLASMEAIGRSDLADGFEGLESETVRGGEAGRQIRIELGGAQELYLAVTGCPDMRWAIEDWAEARLIDKDGRAEYLNSTRNCRPVFGRVENDLTLRAGLYQKMRVGGRTFTRGLCVQANSLIVVPLDGQYTRFEATIGVDAWAGTNGTVRFSVLGARGAARKMALELAGRDFSSGAAKRMLAWEREDRVWEFDWAPGDWKGLAKRYANASGRVPPLSAQATALAAQATDAAGLARVREVYYRSRELSGAVAEGRGFNWGALELAVADLRKLPGYPAGLGDRLPELKQGLERALAGVSGSNATLAAYEAVAQAVTAAEGFRREALLANPLLNFERLMVMKRRPIGDARRSSWEGYGYGEYLGVPRQSSWNNGTMPNIDQWDNEIATVKPVGAKPDWATVYRPPGRRLVTDVDLHWDAGRLLFSMPDATNRWQVWELPLGSAGQARQLTPSHPDVHNYDGIYLPNGRIDFLSTAPLQGVPCNASVIVGMMYQMEGDGRNIRQICFEQDHDYTPSVLNDGRVVYLRWDYTDTPHIWNRLLMSMNPDGTGQMEYYGGNSYWPNSIFYARAIPGHPTKLVTIVTGHHEGRVGELVVLDPAKGRHETSGVVQRIPGRGQAVEAKREDKLTEHSWPKFLHPWPLNEHYFIVSCKPEPDALWGVYLVDVWDNMTLLREEEGFALLEPIPLQPRPVPPVIEDKTRPNSADALVYLEDVYVGPGLKHVPRGTVKALRLFTYHFGYQKLAGIDHRVGADGPWEAKRVLGTVPVEADGSALFKVPAKMPISIQPIDAEGKALALMRSWMTAMPGENVSCVGCHDHKSGAPQGPDHRIALRKPAATIQPWQGPTRGFSFAREVQPVLDQYCVGCHDGSSGPGKGPLDLRADQGGYVVYEGGKIDGKFMRGAKKEELLGKYGAVFEPAYVALRQYVRVGGLESDLHVLPPLEFHANTSELFQMLRRGHHGVRLDAEARERLATWIDLNAPCHGTWSEVTRIPGPGNQCDRRLELRKLYGGLVEDCEVVPEVASPRRAFVHPTAPERPATPALEGWPLGADKARALQAALGTVRRTVQVGNARLELVRIPAGTFVMGDPAGPANEHPPVVTRIERPFWMSTTEISNEQYGEYDSSHDSGFEHRSSWIFSEEYLGWRMNQPGQPVVRISWAEAEGFCRWLSAQLGEPVRLPTEAQWEWACRAGTDTPFWFGGLDTDFAPFANMGDASLRRLADEGWRPKSPDLVAREGRFNDGALVTVDCGRYAPNAWGLLDMHGNAMEWTRSVYAPYAVSADDRRQAESTGERVVRGGSWRDRPQWCRAASRIGYQPWQKVYNVGFRIVIEDGK